MAHTRARLTPEQHREIYELYTGGETAEQVAEQYGCSTKAVYNIVQRLKAAKGERQPAEKTAKRSQINPDFDAAVDQMIAESKTGADQMQEIVPAPSPALPASVPEAVIAAVKAAIAEKEREVCMKLADVRLLQQQIEQLRTEGEGLKAWIEEVEA